VRVAPATKRIKSLPWADSTKVLPHHPSPTMAALIIHYPPLIVSFKLSVARSVFVEMALDQYRMKRMMKLIEQNQGFGELMRDGKTLRQVAYRISRYHSVMDGS